MDDRDGGIRDQVGRVSPGATHARLATFVVFALALGVLALHLAWERGAGLAFPDHHSAGFLGHALTAHDWILKECGHVWEFQGHPGLGNGRWPFPPTMDYPPLSFLLSGVVMVFLGPEVAVARGAQWLFVAGFIAAMGRIGWQLGGFRGCLLLALGAATSPWTPAALQQYSLVPGQLMTVALALSLVLDSAGLTRPRVCAALGVVLGLGMLVKHSFLFFLLPVLVLAALPGLVKSRRSLVGGLAVLAILNLLEALVREGGERMSAIPPGQDWFLVLWGEALFLLLLFAALWLARGGAWTSGSGLGVAVAVAGLVCAPWYLLHVDMMLALAAQQWSHVPLGPGPMPLQLTMRIYLGTLASFYWAGALWIGAGLLLLPAWRPVRGAAPVLLGGLIGGFLAVALLMPPSQRYLAPILPLALAVGFGWAARWRPVFLTCLVLQLTVGPLQVAGWLPGLHEVMDQPGLAGLSKKLAVVGGNREIDLRIPMTSGPPAGPSFLEAVPAGSRAGVDVRAIDEGGLTNFFSHYLEHRATVTRFFEPGPRDLENLDYLLVILPTSGPPGEDPEELEVMGDFPVPLNEGVYHVWLFRVAAKARSGKASEQVEPPDSPGEGSVLPGNGVR